MDKSLKTEFRLDDEIVMRAWREDDVEIAFDIVMRNSDHLQKFMIWMTPDYSLEAAEKFIREGIVKRIEKKNLGLAIFRDDLLIGSVGFNRFDTLSLTCELGYWIDRGEEGKGIVTRCCQTLIEYAFDELEMNRIEIRCSSENARSVAVPERLGFTREALLREAQVIHGRAHDFYVYGLLAKDSRLW